MHNWPISPDFGVLLINLVEQNGYDGVVEFGSGTSTLILAKALDRVARRDGTTSSPLLSFDHLTEYAERTENLLKNARLLERTKVSLAPLAPWQKNWWRSIFLLPVYVGITAISRCTAGYRNEDSGRGRRPARSNGTPCEISCSAGNSGGVFSRLCFSLFNG